MTWNTPRRHLTSLLGALALFAGTLAPAPAEAFEAADGTYFTIDVQLTGGIILEWDNPDQAGNLFGLSIGFDWAYFRVALGVAGVLPASNVEGAFESVWVEALGYPLATVLPQGINVQPYVVLGLGVVTADSIDTPRPADAIPPPAVRWSPRNPRFLFQAGLGVMYGDVQGLYATLDFRAYNHTHGGFNLGVGYRF